jgi:hypothetical protein
MWKEIGEGPKLHDYVWGQIREHQRLGRLCYMLQQGLQDV